MAHALFTTCVFFLFIFYSAQNSNVPEEALPELKIFGIEQFCASHNYHHILKTSKLICLLCKGFDMSCLLKTTTTTAATTSSTDTPTTTRSITSTATTSTTTSTTTTTTPKSAESTTSKS